MKTLLMQDGDIVVTGGSFQMINGAECLRQRLAMTIRCDKGSWFLNPDLGIEWFDIYDQKVISERLIRTEIENILKSDNEVEEVSSITITFDKATRTISVTFVVKSIFGEVTGTV